MPTSWWRTGWRPGIARRTRPAGRGDRRGEDPLWPGHGPGSNKYGPHRSGPCGCSWSASGAVIRSFSRGGYEEIEALAAAGIPVTVVPGVTSAIAVPAMAGVPVTHRGTNHEFVVVSGHLAPDHPESLVNWDALARLSGTLVLLMAVERIELFASVLLAGGRPAETPVWWCSTGRRPQKGFCRQPSRTFRNRSATRNSATRHRGDRARGLIWGLKSS